MQEFFDYLNKIGIKDPSEVERIIFKLPKNKCIDVSKNCCNIINLNKPVFDLTSVFNFSANTSLSGGVIPCCCVECRVRNIYNLSAFAALYSDTILIPNLFDHYHHMSDLKSKEQEFSFYNRLIGDIIVFLNLKPLIEIGRIQIGPTVSSICKDCLSKALEEEKGLDERLDLIDKDLCSDLSKEIKFILDEKKALVIQDNKGYTDVEVFRFHTFPDNLKRYIRKIPYVFNNKEIQELGFIKDIVIRPAFYDLIMQKYSSRTCDLHYLTNRKIDSKIINHINSEKSSYNNNIIEGLVHSLPFLIGADIKKIIKVREEEGSAFEVYRNSIKEVIKETENLDDEKSFKKAINDIVVPEIAKIEQIIDANKKYFQSKMLSKVIFSSILIAIGPNLMGSFLVPFAARDIFKDLSSKLTIPIEARNNSHYFLWKIKHG